MSEIERCCSPDLGELLAAYELGLLPAEDRLRFEEHLAGCSACLEELYEMSPVATALSSEPGRIAARLAEAGVEPGADPAPSPWRGLRILGSPRFYVPALAAAAILLALLMPFGSDDTPEFGKLAMLEALPYVPIDTRPVGHSEAELRFTEGMTNYIAGRYGQAAGQLNEALRLAESPREVDWDGIGQARLYLGVSLLLADRPDQARHALEPLTTSPIRILRERARWYLAQAHLLRGDPEGALVPLAALADSSIAYAERARAQLDLLRPELGEGGDRRER